MCKHDLLENWNVQNKIVFHCPSHSIVYKQNWMLIKNGKLSTVCSRFGCLNSNGNTSVRHTGICLMKTSVLLTLADVSMKIYETLFHTVYRGENYLGRFRG